MNLQQRKELLKRLGKYMLSEEEEWQTARHRAFAGNHWFTPEFIDLAAQQIARSFLVEEHLQTLINRYELASGDPAPKKIGIVMAGNIPLVGFHDLLCVFLSGHHAMIKPSSRDEVLINHLAGKMKEWSPEAGPYITISEMIRHCDAYIATGSNNSSRYFEYYFQKYPNIIRRNRTSVAILTGSETEEELDRLSDDVHQYFGLGCRNVSKIFVPRNYDFVPLLAAFRKYNHLINHHKFKNNYDYNLAVHILNNQYYMTSGSMLVVEQPSVFSPIGQLNFEYYGDEEALRHQLLSDEHIQCVVSKRDISFGEAQCPGICDFADGVDTMAFLKGISARG